MRKRNDVLIYEILSYNESTFLNKFLISLDILAVLDSSKKTEMFPGVLNIDKKENTTKCRNTHVW